MNLRPNPGPTQRPPVSPGGPDLPAQSGQQPLSRAPFPSMQEARAPRPTMAPPKRKSAIPRFFAKFKLPLALAFVGLTAYVVHRINEARQPYEWSGSVEAHTVKVGSRGGGRVKDVFVREGELVKAGKVIVVLEPHDLFAQKAMSQADIALAEANLSKLQHGARPQELAEARARVSQQNAAVAQAEVKRRHEDAELARTRVMVEKGAVSTQELDVREATAAAARGEVEEARARTAEARAALSLLVGGTREEDIRAGEAGVASAKAKLAIIEGQIAELEIRAARDSRVETLNVRPGDLLVANEAAATLLEANETYVRVYVPETLIGKLQIGQEVPVSVDSFPGRTFRARVDHINAVGEYTPRNLTTIDDRANEVFGARIGLIEGQNELRAGMVAFVHVKK